MVTSGEIQTDGRAQRSERSRNAIVGAMLDLIAEGAAAPTAQQVAERADVGVRTVFRHFSDMETLFAAMRDVIWLRVEPMIVTEVQTGPLEDRLDALLERRVQIFEKISPYSNAGIAQRKRSAFLQEQQDRDMRLFRQDLKRWLPEVESAPAEVADALEMALSLEAWDRFRSAQKLSVRRAAGALRELVAPLVMNELEKN
ncbi:MAG: TetR/AcrR family transcriptional regulator [Myxococcota bacterium]